jgi:ankyrin repeat protein
MDDMNLPSIHRQNTLSANKSLLIRLCMCPDENYAMHRLVSLNVYDEFGCNGLMYSLRYQRYGIFKYLLKEKSSKLNLSAKDQQGNTILHYAILYSGNDTQIMEELIEKYKKLGMEIDERNNLGFTPLLLGEIMMNIDRIRMNYLYF